MPRRRTAGNPYRDRWSVAVSVVIHALIIAALLYVRLKPVNRAGLPQPIAISMLPPETLTPTNSQAAAGLPMTSSARQASSAASAASTSAPAPATHPALPPQPRQIASAMPVLSVPSPQSAQSAPFPSAALLQQPFSPVQQAAPTDVVSMRTPPMVLEAPADPEPEPANPAANAVGGAGTGAASQAGPGAGPGAPGGGGNGQIHGGGVAGQGKQDFQFLVLEMNQLGRGNSIQNLRDFTDQLKQCGLAAVKTQDKSWLVTVEVQFDPTGYMTGAQVVDPPALPSDAYKMAVQQLMQPLTTPGCNHLNLSMERPAFHTATLYFYPHGNPQMPDQIPDGPLLGSIGPRR